jgi:hypothetical protein
MAGGNLLSMPGEAPPAKIPDGLVAIVKRDCPTCRLIVPVLGELRAAGIPLAIFTQDDPDFPPGLSPIDDSALATSWSLQIETVPTLLRVEDHRVSGRAEGWQREAWERLSGVARLGGGLPAHRPGCGSRTLEPGVVDDLVSRAVVAGEAPLRARPIVLGELEDPVEAVFARGWSDGLPVVPPTPARVLRMLEGTARPPADVVAVVPPDYAECTVEKVAINAVMAGCRPEFLPVVIAAVEAVCTDAFNMHGVLATTYFVGPLIVVNGPIARAIGMNSGVNALGQGTRANATIGRAVQLVIRNVGGGRPGEVDRATLGQPGKYTFCFAEDEAGSPWEPLSVERGMAPGASAVTVFAAEGPRAVVDQRSRTAESLAGSYAACLRTVAHPKLVGGCDAVVVVSPEHGRVFRAAEWSRARLREELVRRLMLPGAEIVQGAGGIAEGMPEQFGAGTWPKFAPENLLFVHAGGTAGMFSAIIAGWIGRGGSQPVTREVKP